MERYYLCSVTTVPFEDMVKRKAVIEDYMDGSISMAFTIHPTDDNKCLALVKGPNHSKLLSDHRIDPLPIVTLDSKVNDIQSAAKSAMMNALSRRGFPTVFASGDGFRNVIRDIGRDINPNFDENNFDVSE